MSPLPLFLTNKTVLTNIYIYLTNNIYTTNNEHFCDNSSVIDYKIKQSVQQFEIHFVKVTFQAVVVWGLGQVDSVWQSVFPVLSAVVQTAQLSAPQTLGSANVVCCNCY